MNIFYQPINDKNQWVILIILFMISIVVLLKYLFKYRLKEQLSVINKNFWLQNIKPSYPLIFNIYNFSFSLIFSFCLAFIILIAKNNSQNLLPNINLYLNSVSLIFIFLLLKLLTTLLFSVFFDLKNIIIKIIYHKILFLNFISLYILIWLPFVLFTHKYSTLIFKIGVLTTTILFIYFYYLLVKTNLKLLIKHFLYFILYLCALEIASIIILYKVFIL